MLHSTIELIGLAASNALVVFCFCNLIIAILLIGSSETNSKFHEEKTCAFPSVANDDNLNKYTVYSCQKANALIDRVEEEEEEEEKVSSVSADMNGNEEESPGEDKEDDDEEEDELRKRVEEFIQKINTSWRAEKLKTYYLNQ